MILSWPAMRWPARAPWPTRWAAPTTRWTPSAGWAGWCWRRDDGRVTLDFSRLRGPDLPADLTARDFTLNAIAVDLAAAG